MSSEEHPLSSDEAVPAVEARVKKRAQRVRACERCRFKKTRCDGVPGEDPCSQCVAIQATCVFSDKPKTRRDKAYIDSLESQLRRLQTLLDRLHPGEDLTGELDGGEHILHFPQAGTLPDSKTTQSVVTELGVNQSSTFEPGLYASNKTQVDERGFPALNAMSYEAEEAKLTSRWPPELVDSMKDKRIGNPIHYDGESGGARLFHTALDIRSRVEGIGSDRDVMQRLAQSAKVRADFWKPHPWELQQASAQRKCFVFPDPDMLSFLIDTYFSTSHTIAPLLHRGTFERDVSMEKHYTDEAFGSVVLLVCAVGARMSDDPRVLLDHSGKPKHLHSAGLEWYSQVQLVRNAALAGPTLHDLQSIALATVYSIGTSPGHSSWILGITGVRMALDMDMHRQHKVKRNTLEAELWKRAFWVLIYLDVWNSSFLGRPTAIALDSFDVDFPTEVDDRYWTHDDPARSFVQPPGQYSGAGYFLYGLKLNLIHAHALRTIYAPNKERSMAKLGRDEWEQHVTTELDSALQRWADSLPEYLQWNEVLLDPGVEPTLQEKIQTSVLHLLYQHTRITIHRPFVAPADSSSQFSIRSLTICTSAARAVVRVIDVQRRLLPKVMLQVPIIPAFMAGMVLLLRVWFAKRAGMRVDSLEDMKYIYATVHFMDEAEHRWPLAGRLKDLLLALVDVSELSPPPMSNAKRARDDEGHMLRPKPPASATSQKTAAPRRPANTGGSDNRWEASRSLEEVTPATSEAFTFGPPFVQLADGLYPFDPASPGMFETAPLYAPDVATSECRQPQPFYHAGHSHPTIPLDPGATHPSVSSVASEHHQYDRRGTVEANCNYTTFYPTLQAYNNTVPSASYATNWNETQFLNLVTPAMARDAPMANMWSSLPATFQPDQWDRYVSTMAAYAEGGNGQLGAFTEHILPKKYNDQA